MSKLDDILDELVNHYDDGNDYVPPAKQQVKDLILELAEQNASDSGHMRSMVIELERFRQKLEEL